MGTQQQAQLALHHIGRIEAAARQPRTVVWFPLLVFGLINLPAIGLVLLIGRDHLGSYFLPMNAAGAVACVVHYRHSGRLSGLQLPIAIWVSVIVVVSVLGALTSKLGDEQGWDLVNLAGPLGAIMLGYLVLAAWARSRALLAVVAGIAATAMVPLWFLRGDAAISGEIAGMAATQLAVAAANFRMRKTVT